MNGKIVRRTRAEVRAMIGSTVLLICIAASFMACNHKPSADSDAASRGSDYSFDTHYNNRRGAYDDGTYEHNAASNQNNAAAEGNSSSPDPSPSSPASNVSSPSVPDDAYRKGYSNGYDVGIEDGEYGHSREFNYDDGTDYTGRDRSRYQSGYEQGYEDGYNEGRYDYEH